MASFYRSGSPLFAVSPLSRLRPVKRYGPAIVGKCVIADLFAKLADNSTAGVPILSNGTRRSRTSIFRDAAGNVLEFDLEDLVETVVVLFRNPLATLDDLTPLARNIVELMLAERGVTGRILKPYFCFLLAKCIPPRLSEYLIRRVCHLLMEGEPRDRLLPDGCAGRIVVGDEES